MYESLKLHNFTVFADATFEFVKGINVYAGANGSGKTHILKLLYGLQKHQFLAKDLERAELLSQTLLSLFKPESLKRLVRRPSPKTCTVSASWNRKPLEFAIEARSTKLDIQSLWSVPHSPVYIPVTEILGHAVKFLQAYEKRWVDFDVTYRDILLHAAPGVEGERVDERLYPLLKELQDTFGGPIRQSKTGQYYLQSRSGPLEFPLVAEGWRKLGLLWILISNGSLAKGNVFFWDEPEANLNPGMFRLIAEVLARLAESGTQVHVATHSYALLRELEFATVQSQPGYRIFTLNRTTKGVQVEAFERFVDLKPNPILDEYERIYRLTVQEALKGG